MLDENKNTNNEKEEEVNLNEKESELVTDDEVGSINEEVTSESSEQVNELETSEEVNHVENSSEVEAKDKTVSKNSFFRSLKATFVDEIIIGIVSVILLYAADLVLRIVGYYISGKITMMLIIFVIVSLLYPAIMESSKKGNTIGRSLK